MIVTLNDSYPGHLKPGTKLELVGPGHNFLNVECRRLDAPRAPSMYLSPRWFDVPRPAFKRRRVRVMRSVMG